MARSSRRRKRSKKIWLIPLVIVIVLFLGGGAYAFSIYNNAKQTVNNKMHEPVDSIDFDQSKKKVKATKPLHILLMGTDEREGDKGRSDALMVLSLNPENDKMQLVSIPRDTRTEIVGKGTEDKINHAYAFGGSDMEVATVENFLDMDMDYYVRMNMEGLEELVDELGTITVDNEVAWEDDTYDFPEGSVEMDGDKTLSFVRMRKDDPEGDAGRTKRQRQVMEAIVDKGASIGSVSKINSLIDVFGNNMSTNLDFANMKKLWNGYRDTRKDIESYAIEGEGTRIDGIYYLMVPDEEIEKVHEMMEEME